MVDWKEEIRHRLAGSNIEPSREAEIVDELAQHLEDRYVELPGGDATPEEATRVALAELSESELLAQELRRVERPVMQEPVVLGTNRRGRGKVIADLWQDLRYGAQMLIKNPGFALIAIVTLALGIGVNTALFTVFDAFVLKPLPLKNPDRITTIEGRTREGERSRLFSYLDYLDYRDRNTAFAGLAAWNKFSAPLGEGPAAIDESTVVPSNFGFGQIVSGNYFSVLGAEMALVSFVVSRRTREIGIRLALGAQSSDVISLFLRQGSKLIAIGVALGLGGGAAISGLLARVLVDISQFDPLAFFIVAALLAGVALLACWVPARRATKVDPIVALREG